MVQNLTITRKSTPIQSGLFIILAVLLCLQPFTVHALDVQIPRQADGRLLDALALEFWQRLNDARRAPLAVAERLGIPEETVRIVFADQPDILEDGLAPLAWNAQLRHAAAVHGRDMIDRNYYAYTSPEGLTAYDRIVAAGYGPQYTGETLNALFFSNYVEFEFALNQLFDVIVRDELTGANLQRNVFHPDLTEVGVAFYAETADLQPELPYAYLMVADFAAPVAPQRYLIVNTVAEHRLVVKPMGSGWYYPEALHPGIYQLAFPDYGIVMLPVAAGGMGELGPVEYLYDDRRSEHVQLNLRF